MLTDRLQRRLQGIEDASQKGRRVKDLYRMMYDQELWLAAYNNVRGNAGAVTPGVDNNTLDGFSTRRVNNLIARLKEGTYSPKPVRRTHIPKANGKMRPLGIPSGDDKLVQEMARMLLERIYEPVFSDRSHGFRSGRSCHTALRQVERLWSGVKWIVDVDIEGFFDNIDHEALVGLLREKIDDKRFVDLIWKMLRAGYMEGWKFYATFSGTPQGGIISPLLANIVLNELDKFMARKANTFNMGKKRGSNSEYLRWRSRAYKVRKRIKVLKQTGGDPQEVDDLRREEARYMNEMRKFPHADMYDSNYRRLQYVRYADDFVIGIIGSKQDAMDLMDEVKHFLSAELKLTASEEKSNIAHIKDGCRFLGYDIRLINTGKLIRKRVGGRVVTARSTHSQVGLYVPEEKVQAFCTKNGYGNYDRMRMIHRPYLQNSSDVEIILTYNAELRGFANYYALAKGYKHALSKLQYMAHYSLLKTLAWKRKRTVAKTARMLREGTDFVYRYKANGKAKALRVFKLKYMPKRVRDFKIDLIPNTLHYSVRTELIERLEANECEYCGREDTPCEVHHIRKLSDLQGKDLPEWKEIMIARSRKTLVLCEPCHEALHAGRLPDLRFAS